MGWSEEDEYQEQQIRKRIAEAVAEEREACAQIADRVADGFRKNNDLRGVDFQIMAEAIRERTK